MQGLKYSFPAPQKSALSTRHNRRGFAFVNFKCSESFPEDTAVPGANSLPTPEICESTVLVAQTALVAQKLVASTLQAHTRNTEDQRRGKHDCVPVHHRPHPARR